jgi:hypothetical protein
VGLVPHYADYELEIRTQRGVMRPSSCFVDFWMKPPQLMEFGVQRHTLVRREDYAGSSLSYRFRLWQRRDPTQVSAQVF